MVDLSPVLLVLLSAGGSGVLRAHVQGLLYHHPMAPCLPGVHSLLNPPSDYLGCGYMIGSLQNHRLKDNEPLQVPQYVPHPVQIFHQGHHEASPKLPAWNVIAP